MWRDRDGDAAAQNDGLPGPRNPPPQRGWPAPACRPAAGARLDYRCRPADHLGGGRRAGPFQPLNRLGAEAVGSGLGLAVARAIVEQHGGRLWYEHPPERGVTFHLALPSVSSEEGPCTS